MQRNIHGSTQALNTRTSCHSSNIKIEENRKLNVLKHLCKCSQGKFKIIPIYQKNDYMLPQIKEKKFIDKSKPKLNETWIIHTHTNKKKTNKHIHVYIHTQIKKISWHIHREKITISEIWNHSNTYTHTIYQISEANEG